MKRHLDVQGIHPGHQTRVERRHDGPRQDHRQSHGRGIRRRWRAGRLLRPVDVDIARGESHLATEGTLLPPPGFRRGLGLVGEGGIRLGAEIRRGLEPGMRLVRSGRQSIATGRSKGELNGQQSGPLVQLDRFGFPCGRRQSTHASAQISQHDLVPHGVGHHGRLLLLRRRLLRHHDVVTAVDAVQVLLGAGVHGHGFEPHEVGDGHPAGIEFGLGSAGREAGGESPVAVVDVRTAARVVAGLGGQFGGQDEGEGEEMGGGGLQGGLFEVGGFKGLLQVQESVGDTRATAASFQFRIPQHGFGGSYR